MALMKEYARGCSDEAFATVVSRHIHLVYSVALRQVRDAQLAEEITQATFIILARKAKSLGEKTILSAWLCRTARYVSADALKIRRRRQLREQEAHMQSVLTGSEPEIWTQIEPLLDPALAQLGEKDHNAIVLRFFENKNMSDVGVALGTSEDAAKMRVNRALEKLRKIFTESGVFSTADIIAGAISAKSVGAAPLTLAKSVAAVAITKGAAATDLTLTLVSKTMRIMKWMELKLACEIGAAVLLGGSIVTVAVTGKADQDRYQVDGNLTYRTANYNAVRNFTLTVNGSNWAVHLTDPEMRLPIEYQEVVQLNHCLYRYDYYGKFSPSDSAPGSALIKRGDFPTADGAFADIIWVGLASAHYFSAATHEDVFSLWNRPGTNKINATW
jgi:RNA polymerase sigma factor (sigma-70 family)